MKLSKNLIRRIVTELSSSIYVVGFSVENSKINKIKIYNKIYEETAYHARFVKNFGGNLCHTHFTVIKDWMIPGFSFSGFTIGIEFHIEKDTNKHYCGYGFKKIYGNKELFHSFILNNDKNIITQEDYKYEPSYGLINKPFDTPIIERKVNSCDDYCFCPASLKKKLKDIQKPLFNCVSLKNQKLIKTIKKHNFSIVNYGESGKEEKIYFLNKNKNKIEPIFELIIDMGFDLN